MSPHRSGLVVLHLSPAQAHLPEYLAELGCDVAQIQWGLTQRAPRVIITDQAQQFAGNRQLREWLSQHHAGLILIGRRDVAKLPSDLRADVVLPTDASGREVATAIELVSEICEQRRRLRHEREECERWMDLAMHDSLTRLPNRRAWDKQLTQGLASKQPLCIGIIDVDFFKLVNDRDGHNIGDAVLIEASRVLRAQLRSDDVVARLGGDEFGVILFDVDHEAATAILERIRRAVSAELARQGLPSPTLSAGIVLVRDDASRDAGGVFAAAAASLQAAKQQNRDRINVYTPALPAPPRGAGSRKTKLEK